MDGSAAMPPAGKVEVGRVEAGQETRARTVEFLAAARGAALLYIVFDHAIAAIDSQAPNSSRWQAFLQGFFTFDHATGNTRLGVLVFMTGLFLERSLAKGHLKFLASRAGTLLWPLLLWGLVQALLFTFTPWSQDPTSANSQIGLGLMRDGLMSLDPVLMLRGWWRLAAQLWFLDMLVLFILLFLVLRRLPSWLVLIGAVLVFAFSLTLSRPVNAPLTTALFALGPHFLYFWLGTMTTDWVVRRGARITPGQTLLAAALFLVISIPPVALGRSDWQVFAFVAGLPALPLILNGAKWLLRTPLRPVFLWLGRSSLLVLCLHMLCLTVILTLARVSGLTSPLPLLALCMLGGLALCFLIDMTFRRLGWSAALGLQPGR